MFRPHKELDLRNKVKKSLEKKKSKCSCNLFHFIFGLDGENDYKTLTQRVSQQVFHINGNITSIERLVGFLGTARDTPDIRNKLYSDRNFFTAVLSTLTPFIDLDMT